MPRPSVDRMARLMSEFSGHDPDTSKAAYLALVRAVSRELRTQGIVYLPKLGTYKVACRGEGVRRLQAGRNGESYRQWLPAHRTLKFVPSRQLREYIRNVGTASVPPRQFEDSRT